MENFYIRGDSQNLAQIISQDKTSYKLRNICSVRITMAYSCHTNWSTKIKIFLSKLFICEVYYSFGATEVNVIYCSDIFYYSNYLWRRLHHCGFLIHAIYCTNISENNFKSHINCFQVVLNIEESHIVLKKERIIVEQRHDWGMLHSDSIATIHSSLRATNVYCQLHWLRQSCHAFIIFLLRCGNYCHQSACATLPFHFIEFH